MAHKASRTQIRWVVAALLAVALASVTAAWALTHRYEAPEPPGAAATSSQGPVVRHAPVPSATGSTSGVRQATPSAARPTRVSIPSIGVSLQLIALGLQPDGTLAVPSGADELKGAWFTGSPVPGSAGPAVIEAHVTTANGRGPFFRLGEVRVGDQVRVGSADGRSVTFTVYRLARYAKDDFPTGQVYGNTAGPELRLITCGGEFDRSTGHFNDNTVVYARLAGAT